MHGKYKWIDKWNWLIKPIKKKPQNEIDKVIEESKREICITINEVTLLHRVLYNISFIPAGEI